MLKKFLLISIGVYFLLVATNGVSFAQVSIDPDLRPNNVSVVGEPGENTHDKPDTPESRVVKIVGTVINVLLAVSAMIAVVFIIISAWTMVISRGEEESITEAKRSLTWAILGLVFLLFAYVIVRFVISFVYTADTPAEAANLLFLLS